MKAQYSYDELEELLSEAGVLESELFVVFSELDEVFSSLEADEESSQAVNATAARNAQEETANLKKFIKTPFSRIPRFLWIIYKK